MKLRTILATAAIAMFAANAVAAAEETHILKLSTFLPPGNVMVKEFERWGAELEEKSGGRLKLEIFNASQMGPPPQQYDLARNGVADIAYALHGFAPGRFPLTEIAYLPGLFKSAEQGSIALSSLVPEFLAEEHKGTHLLYIVSVPPIGILTKDIKIETAAALKGMRIRPPGSVIGASIAAVGGVPAAVPPGEMGDALGKGVIDGLVTTIEAAEGFHFVNLVNYKNAINVGTATFSLVMNPESYNALPDDLRAIIDETTGPETSARIGRIYDEAEAAAWDRQKEHVTLVAMPEAEAAILASTFQEFTDGMIADLDAKGHKASAFYKALKAALE